MMGRYLIMRFSEETLDELKRICKVECGEELDRGGAGEIASRVVALYGLLAKKLLDEKTSGPKRPENERPPIGFLP